MDIDDLLAQSAPPPADRTPELKEALRLMAAAAESQERAPGRTRRTLLAGTTSAIVVLGLAAATVPGFGITPGFIDRWMPWTTGGGSGCAMQFGAKPHSNSPSTLDNEDFVNERAAVVDEANRFLATFDLDSIDEAEAIREWQRREDAAIAALPSVEENPRIEGEQQERLTGDDLVMSAMWNEVEQAVDAHLASMGMPTGGQAVSVSATWRCE